MLFSMITLSGMNCPFETRLRAIYIFGLIVLCSVLLSVVDICSMIGSTDHVANELMPHLFY